MQDPGVICRSTYPSNVHSSMKQQISTQLSHPFIESFNCTINRREDLEADLVGFEDALASSSHARFSSVTLQLLVPCMRLILPCIRLHKESQGTSEAPLLAGVASMQARGRCWALLGAARLWLVAPAAGTDPAMKFALKKQHLSAHQEHDLQPEIEVSMPLLLEYYKPRDYHCWTHEFVPLKCTHVLNIHTVSLFCYYDFLLYVI